MKKILVILFIFLILVMAGCTDKQAPNVVDAYTMVIDKLYMEDSGLNDGIKYLAIDTSLMVNLTDDVKKAELLKQLKNYGFIVLDTTFEELEKKGYIHDLYFKEGILFRIEDEPIKNNSIIMKASKWRSGTGAMGYDNLIIEYKNNKWKISKSGSPWIS